MVNPAHPALGPLRANSWFATLPETLRSALLDAADVQLVQPGNWLFGTGDSPRGIFAVLDGSALTYVALPHAEDTLVHVLQPGEVFGHAARLAGGPRLATVLAAERSTFLYVGEAGLQQVGARHPGLWPALTQLLYEQLGSTLALLALLLRLPTDARVAARLLQLARPATDETPTVHLPQTHLAELVGVSRKTVNQALRRLQARGAVSLARGRVLLRDPAALEQLSSLPD